MFLFILPPLPLSMSMSERASEREIVPHSKLCLSDRSCLCCSNSWRSFSFAVAALPSHLKRPIFFHTGGGTALIHAVRGAGNNTPGTRGYQSQADS